MTGFATIDSEENVRRSKLVSLLDKVIGQCFMQDGKCIPDGAVLAFHDKIQIYLIVDEEKNELGDGGLDPLVQAPSSSLHISSQKVK